MPSCSMVVAKLSAPTVTVAIASPRSWRSRPRSQRTTSPDASLLPVGDPEPDLTLHHDGVLPVDPADSHCDVVVVVGPLLAVRLGDAGDVAPRLGGVGDLHALRDPAPVARDAGLGE